MIVSQSAKAQIEKEVESEKEIDTAIYGSASIQQYKKDVAFKTLVEGIEADLYVIPKFQRVYKWKETQVEELAVSLVKGMPIPPIYAYRNEENQLEILDGQQRILSMYLYYKGRYMKRKNNNYVDLRHLEEKSLKQLIEDNSIFRDKEYKMKYYDLNESEEKSVDITYHKLPQKVQRKLDFTDITIIEINIDNKSLKERYLYKIFSNLNTGGTPLTGQELRNGIYRCPFYEMLFKFNEENAIWKTLFKRVEIDSTDIEYLLRMCSLKYFVTITDNRFQIKDYKKKEKLLNDFSEKAKTFTDTEIAQYKHSLEGFMQLIEGKLIKDITLLESLFVVVDKVPFNIPITANLCEFIKETADYKKTIKQGNVDKRAIEEKLKAVYNGICKYFNQNK